jgi:hypothetical protein
VGFEIRATPCERGLPEVLDKSIGAKPRVTAVAVGEGVDADETVMKLN